MELVQECRGVWCVEVVLEEHLENTHTLQQMVNIGTIINTSLTLDVQRSAAPCYCKTVLH